MENENNKKCNALVHGPSCTTWPPPWLTTSTPTPAASTLPTSTPTLIEPPAPTTEAAAENEARPGRVPPDFPPDAVIVVADAEGYTDRRMKGAPFMWTWIDGPTWFYVRDFPIPDSRKRLA